MTLAGVGKIQEYVTRGLPIVLSGGLPGIYAAANGSDTATIQAKLKELSTSANVYTVSEDAVAEKLASLGLAPNVKVQTTGKWLTTWREDLLTGIDYALIFADTNTSSGYVTVTGPAKDKTPYYLNAWTGEKEPVFTYNVSDSELTLPVSLKGNQTLILAFFPHGSGRPRAPKIHATETPASVVGSTFDYRNGWIAHIANETSGATPARIQLSDNQYVELPQQIPSAYNLSNWTLVAEHWEASSDLYDAATIAQKHNTTHELSSLVSWSTIPALTKTFGLGYYSTTFQWPPAHHGDGGNGAADGAYIVFPSILHAIQVSVNGERVPPLDYTDARMDITQYLKRGRNEVLAVVPTTMWNYIRSILSDIRDQGHLAGFLTEGLPEPVISENGLIEEVSIIPYVKLSIPSF